MDYRETNQRLDRIAAAIGGRGGSAELLNMLHACRPGHPLNALTQRPFTDLRFCMAGRTSALDVDHRDIDWIDRMASAELEAEES